MSFFNGKVIYLTFSIQLIHQKVETTSLPASYSHFYNIPTYSALNGSKNRPLIFLRETLTRPLFHL